MANLPNVLAGVAIAGLGLNFWRLYPVRGSLLVISGRARFALPLECRFDLGLCNTTRIGSFWIELVFSDCPNSRFLVLKDQIEELKWRRLCLILREGV